MGRRASRPPGAAFVPRRVWSTTTERRSPDPVEAVTSVRMTIQSKTDLGTRTLYAQIAVLHAVYACRKLAWCSKNNSDDVQATVHHQRGVLRAVRANTSARAKPSGIAAVAGVFPPQGETHESSGTPPPFPKQQCFCCRSCVFA